ncbi:MAG: quinone oxidoreductase family protein [Gemmatimonadota bacterium]
MRVVEVSQFGGPEVLTPAERPDPVPGPGQLLVDVAAAGVNYMDIYQREGRPPYASSDGPFVPGAEGAGTVTALGRDVAGFAPGDRVAWTGIPGSYAEQVVLPADRAVAVPGGMDLQAAAAIMLQGCTAHYLCHDTYPVADGDPVVVHAAAGGVGLLLTQLVKLRGGVVIATVSTPAKAELARGAGADHVAGYGDFGDVVREETGDGAAAVYDGVGQATFDASLAALRPRGMLVLYGAASGPVPPFDLQLLAPAGSLFVTRPTLVHYVASPADLRRRTADLFGWVTRGELSVRIGGTYPLSDAARAQEDLAARRTTGKLLLIP